MKFPKDVNTYCPKCKKHTKHTTAIASKGRARSMAFGTLKHNRKMTGHGGKRAGEKTVRKQGKRQKIVLTCLTCKKKHERVIAGRTKKKLEITK